MFSPSSAMSWCHRDITPSSPFTNTQDKADSSPHPSNADSKDTAEDDADNDAADNNADNNADADTDNNNAMQTIDNDADAMQHRCRTMMLTMMPPPRQWATTQMTTMQL
jgi:hypothetical protein